MKRALWWLLALVVTVVGLALLVPQSPWFVSNLLVPKTAHDGKSVAAWAEQLKSGDQEARRQAIFSLGALGAAGADAVPMLGAIASDDKQDRELRKEAVLALSKMAPASKAALPDLIKALENDIEDIVRMNAAFALMRLGSDAKAAIPALLKAMKEDRNQTNAKTFQQTIQEVVILALGRASHGSADAVPALTETLEKAPSLEIRIVATRALGDVGPEAKPAAPLLRKLLTDKVEDVRLAAEEALKKIGEG